MSLTAFRRVLYLVVICFSLRGANNCTADVPPKAALLSISAPGPLGDSTITGAPGAVPGGSKVLLVTLNTGHSANVTSAQDGSFTATLFAPPGVSVLVKAGFPVPFNRDFYICFPGTIIGADQPAPGSPGLAVVGAGPTNSSQLPPAWTFQGSVNSRQFTPGDTLSLKGTLSIVSAALQSGGKMTVGATIFLERLSGPDGAGGLGENTLASIFTTPTGFAIEREQSVDPSKGTQFPLTQPDASHASAAIDLSLKLPATLLAGFYRPFVTLTFSGVPVEQNAPPLQLIGNAHRLAFDPQTPLVLPLIRIGAPKAPRLYWTLLTDELSNGSRGVGAIEDRGSFAVASRIVTQSDTFIIPRTDPATGSPIPYRLEPFALTVSVSNGSNPMPSIPNIPFRFPSGSLTVTVQRPDGETSTIGPAPFLQSRSRELTSLGGQTIDPAGGHIQDAYQLTTLDPRFEVTFPQDGRYVITMSGSIDDVYGTTWSASGTYEVYVARPLSLDTAVLPGTPFEAGDTFAPTVIVHPAAPAAVEIRLRLLPDSNPSAAIDTTLRGQANAFGYFRPEGNGLPLAKPGEYRVDVTASITDKSGNLWMGSRTWGGVVAPKAATLIGHGRRGTDQTDLKGTQWFYRTQTGIPAPSSDHIRFPFNGGDVVWGQLSDAVAPVVTFQDPSGAILRLLRSRPIQGHPEELDLGQAPIYLSRPDGQEPQLDPSKVDIWAYAYNSVQRPLVSVRQEILGGVTTSPYWRFKSVSYGQQLGANEFGDLTNHFKFQYGGVVLRGSALARPEYAVYGSLFVLVPDDDPLGGSRVFPPFQGNGGGPSGGPLMTLKGRPIDAFFHPTAVRPGTVLETGDTFALAGAVAPTLPAQVSYTVTTPSGTTRSFSGRANKIGYYYQPAQDFVVSEPGIYTVDVKVTFDGATSAGQLTQPFPTGDILGTSNGRFYFYVTPSGSPPLPILVSAGSGSTLQQITATLGSGHITGTIPGYVLESGPVMGTNGSFRYTYDPKVFANDFPINVNQPTFGDLFTVTLFDSTSNRARILSFSGKIWLTLDPRAVVGAVVNPATGAETVVAGSIASSFGANLASDAASAPGLPLPSTLAGATARMNGVAAPLLYASPRQVNFQVPWELAGQSQADLVISGSTPVKVNLAPASPGIFAVVPQGRFLTIYCTGLGAVSSPPATGAAAPASTLIESVAKPVVNVGSGTAVVMFSGLAPGFAGVYQVNAQLPDDVASGSSVSVSISISGVTSNSVTVVIP